MTRDAHCQHRFSSTAAADEAYLPLFLFLSSFTIHVPQVVRLHSGGDYRVHFIGFTGGFPYLGGLPAELATVPRLSTPRQLVPKGSVGIAAGAATSTSFEKCFSRIFL